MAGCNTGRNVQKYKGSGASTLQDALENGNTAPLTINLTSPGVFVGDGGGLSNISASSTTGNLQSVTDNGATTTNKITFSNGVTSLQTSGNVVITGNVTATDFRGDGGTLSNIAANKNFQEVTDLGATTTNKITLTNSATSLQTTGKIVSLTLEANVNASNIVTADGRGINQLNASNVSIGTLAIARGGTGADTASAAASALGLGVEDQPSFVTVNANVNASNVVTNDGSGINQLNASNVSIGEIPIARGGTGATSASAAATALGVGTGDKPSFVTVNANVNASNVVSSDIYGTIQGSNTISSSTVNAITLNANVNASNVVSTDIYGTIKGSNTVTAITLNANVNASNIVTSDGRGINQLNASNVNTGTLIIARGGTGAATAPAAATALGVGTGDQPSFVTVNANVNASNVVTNDGSGINQLNASNVSIGTLAIARGGTGADSASAAATALGLGTGDQPSFVTLNTNVNASNVVSTDIYGTIQGSNTISSSTVNAITLNANVNASNIVTNDGSGINQLNASNVNAGTLAVDRGGTGYDSYVEGQILMANTVGGVVTLTKLTPGSSGDFLKSRGNGSHLEWASITDVGSPTEKSLFTGDYLTGANNDGSNGGGHTGADHTTIHADATTTNTAGKLVARDDLGDIYASNVSSSSNVNAITLKANVIASNVVSTDIYGTIQGSNTVTAITVTGNVVASNVVSTDIFGTIKGSNTVTAMTLTGNVNAGNVVTSDGRGINQLNASNVNTGKLVIARGGTGLEAVGENVLLLGPSSGTELTKLTPYTTDSTKKFLRSNNSGVGWDDVSSTTMTVTNDADSTNDQGIIYAEGVGSSKSLESDATTLKYKRCTGTLTTSNVITSDTSVDARNGIANTTSTHTLSVGTVVSIRESASGDVFIVRKGDGYFSENVYIAKKLTVPVGGEILADKITVRSLETKGSVVFANRPPTSGIVLG